MAQTTNLNVSPYFDDFNADDNYYKVLFKPGLPVQARELTGLQSILQNQIAKFGQHFFKEGSKVIPGNTQYNDNFDSIQINNEYLGITVQSYVDQLLNQKNNRSNFWSKCNSRKNITRRTIRSKPFNTICPI